MKKIKKFLVKSLSLVFVAILAISPLFLFNGCDLFDITGGVGTVSQKYSIGIVYSHPVENSDEYVRASSSFDSNSSSTFFGTEKNDIRLYSVAVWNSTTVESNFPTVTIYFNVPDGSDEEPEINYNELLAGCFYTVKIKCHIGESGYNNYAEQSGETSFRISEEEVELGMITLDLTDTKYTGSGLSNCMSGIFNRSNASSTLKSLYSRNGQLIYDYDSTSIYTQSGGFLISGDDGSIWAAINDVTVDDASVEVDHIQIVFHMGNGARINLRGIGVD